MKRGRRTILAPVAGLALLLANPLQAAPVDVAVNAQIEAQARHIDSLQEAVNTLQQRQFEIADRVKKLEELRAEVAELTEKLKQVRNEVGTLQSDISGLSNEFKDYQTNYRKFARYDAVGEKLPALAANGKVYEKVVIRRVTDTGLDIRHSGGSTRVMHNQLPTEFRDRFQWDSTVADIALAEEAKDDVLRDRLVAISQEQAKQKKEEAARIAATDKRFRDLEQRIATAATASSSRIGSSGKLGERRMVGNGSSSRYRYSRNRYDRPTIYYYPSRYNGRSSGRSSGRASVPRVSPVVPRPRVRPTSTPRVCPTGRD